MTTRRPTLPALAALLLAACGGGEPGPTAPVDPYAGVPPLGAAIGRTEGTEILDGGGGATGWRWVPFADTLCTDATNVGGSYQFSTSSTGLAINWGPETGTDVVFFLQGGGACWDFITCGGAAPYFDKTAATGPFGPAEFLGGIYSAYPNSWVRRANLPAALADATIVFLPYCTGDVHGGDAVTTYTPPPELAYLGLSPITWHHAGHSNVMAFLERLGATFSAPGRMVVAGSSAGGFGSLLNYRAFRWYWPDAKGYLIDDSAPPLIGDAIPPSTRAAWYASWNLGAALDFACPGCRTDMSLGLGGLAATFPDDRIALISHLEDEVIRAFYGTYTIVPPAFTSMDAITFEAQLRLLGSDVIAPAPNARYFFSNTPTPTAHPALEDPTTVTTPGAGLADWVGKMVGDDAGWVSLSDP